VGRWQNTRIGQSRFCGLKNFIVAPGDDMLVVLKFEGQVVHDGPTDRNKMIIHVFEERNYQLGDWESNKAGENLLFL
jgi:hypothetical protein